MSEVKRVYRFGGRNAEGDGTMRNLLGGKGANLAEMCKINIPVPAGAKELSIRLRKYDAEPEMVIRMQEMEQEKVHF